MAKIQPEVLLVLMVAAVGIVGLVLLMSNIGYNDMNDITGEAYKSMSIGKAKLSSTKTAKAADLRIKKSADDEPVINAIAKPDEGILDVNFQVENAGGTAAQPDAIVVQMLYLLEDGKSDILDKTFSETTSIAAGDSEGLDVEFSLDSEILEKIVSAEVTIFLDRYDVTAETDESNNIESAVLTLSETRGIVLGIYIEE